MSRLDFAPKPPYSGGVMRYAIMLVLCVAAGVAMGLILWLFLRRIRRIEHALWESRKAIGMRNAEAPGRAQTVSPEPER
jgi:hypothetical protein